MLKKYLLVGLLILLSGCAFVHKIDVQQGNVVEEKALNQLALGMSSQQVKMILGTPLVQDVFHANRWDYYYSMHQQGELQKNSLITLYFDDKGLKDLVGENAPKLKKSTAIEPVQRKLEPIL
jgi:outer membrane protein assembly factor BamE